MFSMSIVKLDQMIEHLLGVFFLLPIVKTGLLIFLDSRLSSESLSLDLCLVLIIHLHSFRVRFR